MDQLTDLSTTPLYLISFVGLMTGVLGSTHCVGMCGGLVIALGRGFKNTFAYQVGRLIGYSTLGIGLPLLGLNIAGLQNNKTMALIGAFSMGFIFIFIGLKHLFSWKKTFLKHDYLEKLNLRIWNQLFTKFKNFAILRSFLAGSASALLPCGLLWTILILSFTATNPIIAFVFVASFWLGTIPALTFAPEIIKKILTPLLEKLPRTIPLFLILIGLSTISYRVFMLYSKHSCH